MARKTYIDRPNCPVTAETKIFIERLAYKNDWSFAKAISVLAELGVSVAKQKYKVR